MNAQSNEGVAADQVLTVEEGVERKRSLSGRADGPEWHWMGNFSDPVAAVTVANQPPACPAGGVVFTVNGNVVPAWMFF